MFHEKKAAVTACENESVKKIKGDRVEEKKQNAHIVKKASTAMPGLDMLKIY